MATPQVSTGAGSEPAETGAYYRREDTPGFFVRVLVGLIDWIVVVMLALGLSVALLAAVPRVDPAVLISILVVACWAYLVLLKRSRIGSVGYRVFGLKIVDLQGRQPGILRMTLRLLVSLGFNPVLDLIWLTSDASRQGLRDKLCGTYVVRRSATEAGRGRLVYANLFFVGMSLIFREVRRDA